MNKYEDEGIYTDGEDKKPRFLIIIGFVVLAVIILVLIISCSFAKKNSNSYLSYVRISNGEITPAFNKDILEYNVKTDDSNITISCGVEDPNATVDGCNKRISLENDLYVHNVVVTAEDGSLRTYKFNFGKEEVDELANVKVNITADIASGEETNKAVLLEANTDPKIMNAKYQWFKDDKEISGATTSTYKASASGNYFVIVTTASSKLEINSEEYVVNIVKKENNSTSNNGNGNSNTNKYTLKINSIKGNATKWSKKVTLTVNVTASNGLATQAYSFDGGKTYQKGNTKTFTKNQTVNIVVKDSKGNKISKSIIISKVDATVPTGKIVASNKSEVAVTLTAKPTPTTTPSGYKYQWYKNDKAISGATKATYNVNSIGNYKVKITTGVGNSVTTSVYSFKPEVGELKCPRLTVTTESGKPLAPEVWTTENVYIKIEPAKYTASYDILMNEYNNLSTISQEFSYYTSYTIPSILKITQKGMRRAKFIVKDINGKSITCFSLAYYLK